MAIREAENVSISCGFGRRTLLIEKRCRASSQRRVQDPAMAEGIAKRRDPGSPKGIGRACLGLRAETAGLRENLVDRLGLGILQADRGGRKVARKRDSRVAKFRKSVGEHDR